MPVGWSVNPQVACVSPMMLHHEEDEAIRRGVEGANFFGYSLGHFYVFGEHRPGVTDVWSEYEQRRSAQGFDPEAVARAVKEERLGAKVAAGDTTGLRGAIGTPDQVREYLRRYEEAGVDQVIFVLQAGRNRHEHIMESIEVFGREVLPEFLDRDEAASGRRRSGWRQPSLLRWPASTTSPATWATTRFPAIPRQWADAAGSEEMREPGWSASPTTAPRASATPSWASPADALAVRHPPADRPASARRTCRSSLLVASFATRAELLPGSQTDPA